MESDRENDPRAHSTPKRDKNPASKDHISTPGSDDLCGRPEAGGGWPSPEQTGNSTRSLLSVLSHSSVENISRGSYSSSDSSPSNLTSRKRRSKSPPSSSVSHSKSATQSSRSSSRHGRASSPSSKSSSRTTPVSIASSSSSSKTLTESPSEPQLTPWEKWLVRKTEEERKRVRLQVRREREELRRKEEIARVKKEKELVIKVRVDEWIEEKTKSQQERRKRKERLERRKKEKKEEEEQQILERSKSSRQQWLADKKKKEQEQKLKEEEEKALAAKTEQERRAKAEEAYIKWHQEASKKSKPIPSSFGVSQGMMKGYYDTAAYPLPNFYNPIPWMPIHVPKPTEGEVGGPKRGPGGRSSKKNRDVVLQPASPPLLFKDRQTVEKCNRWGRPR